MLDDGSGFNNRRQPRSRDMFGGGMEVGRLMEEISTSQYYLE
jgi:hypothetical protein